MLTINNNKISNKYLKSKELLSFLLKKSLDNRLTILEQKNNKEKTNLLSMKEISNNMLSFLKESSQKLIIKPHSKNNYSNHNNHENTIIKKLTKTFTNKNKQHLQSRTPLETTPIKPKRKNSKEKIFDNKIKKKKKMSITPLERSPNDKIIRSRRTSKMSKKININSNNKSEMNSSKVNDNSSIIEQYRKKKPKMQLKKNNTTLLLVTKQSSVMNLKKVENNNNNNKNRNKILHINNSHTVSPLRIKNKKLKKNHSKFRRKNNSVYSKKRSKRNINNNNEKEFKSSNTINSFYKSNKNDIKNEKKYNITKISNIKNKLDLLCDNNLFGNDIRLNELNIDDLQQNNNTISSPLHNTEDKDKTFSSLNQSLLKLTNEDDSLYMDNYLYNPNTYENNNYNNKINFEECLETSIEYICGYLPIKDLFSLGLINKEFYKIIIRYLISKTENKMENIKIQITELIKANNTIDINEKEIKKFECNANSTRAITLLNSISKNNIFKLNSPLMNNKDIIFILELFFIAIGRKYDIIKYDNEEENISNSKKWNYACKYFKENDKKNLGVIFEKELINKKYNEEIINSLFEWSYKNIPKITPNYYKKIDKDIAIFVFIIKDLLDFFGISQDKKVNPQKLFVLYNIRLRVQDKLIQKLNKLLSTVK
jgi:hypothetical protein